MAQSMNETIPDSLEGNKKASRQSRHSQNRSAARLAAVQALYQMEQSGSDAHQVMQEFITYRLGKPSDADFSFEADQPYFSELLKGTSLHQDALDQHIKSALSAGWSLDRLESVVRAILRVGAYELQEMTHIPTPIILNEYIDITHAFFKGKEPAFVNGVLHRLASHFRPLETQKAPHESH